MQTFERVGALSWGYVPAEVDDFLARAKQAYSDNEPFDFDETTVRNAGFARIRRGYRPDVVDAAMDRLEAAFIQRRRSQTIAEQGESGWLNAVYDEAKSLYPRLLRPVGERFSHAVSWGYRKEDVDTLMEKLTAYFDGKAPLSSAELRNAVFGQAKGAKAYDEAVVDVYLERAITVLVAVE
ncbi:MAG: DivIVA domain-containing protein [Ancrocorticia sp.]